MGNRSDEVFENKEWSWDNVFSTQGGLYTALGLKGGFGKDAGGLAGAGYLADAAAQGIGMFTTAVRADAMSSAYRAQGELAARDAAFQGQFLSVDLRRQGDAAVKNIGIVQQQGLDAATLRYNALGNEIARQRVSAAGSGIDLSSRTVGKAEETSRRNAAWDVSRISRSTKISADNLNEQAEMAYKNSAFATVSADYQGKMAKIQGDMNADLAEISGTFGMIRGGINMGVNAAKAGAFAYMAG